MTHFLHYPHHFPTTTTMITTTTTTTTTESIRRVLRDYHARINALEEEKFDLEYVVKRKDFEVATVLQHQLPTYNYKQQQQLQPTFVDLFSVLFSPTLSLSLHKPSLNFLFLLFCMHLAADEIVCQLLSFSHCPGTPIVLSSRILSPNCVTIIEA